MSLDENATRNARGELHEVWPFLRTFVYRREKRFIPFMPVIVFRDLGRPDGHYTEV